MSLYLFDLFISNLFVGRTQDKPDNTLANEVFQTTMNRNCNLTGWLFCSSSEAAILAGKTFT